jgi:hypothetical protein
MYNNKDLLSSEKDIVYFQLEGYFIEFQKYYALLSKYPIERFDIWLSFYNRKTLIENLATQILNIHIIKRKIEISSYGRKILIEKLTTQIINIHKIKMNDSNR